MDSALARLRDLEDNRGLASDLYTYGATLTEAGLAELIVAGEALDEGEAIRLATEASQSASGDDSATTLP